MTNYINYYLADIHKIADCVYKQVQITSQSKGLTGLWTLTMNKFFHEVPQPDIKTLIHSECIDQSQKIHAVL